MSSSIGANGQPDWVTGDAPSLAATFKELAEYALFRGGRMVGTTAERNAFSSATYAREGDEWDDITLDVIYRWSGSTWVALTAPKRSYTPTITGITGASLTAVWSMAGGLVTVSGQLAANKLWSAWTGPVLVSVPTGSVPSNIGTILGAAMIVDESSGALYEAVVRRNDATTVTVEWVDASATPARLRAIPGTMGITSTNGVTLSLQFSYYPA